MEYTQALDDLKEELKPFFEGIHDTGTSVFDCSRVWNVERQLEIDDDSFKRELFEYLEETYDCSISEESTDMGSYVVVSNGWDIDENGNAFKKLVT